METLERMPFKARKAVFKRLEDVVTLASLNKAERRLYEENLKVYRRSIGTTSRPRRTRLIMGCGKAVLKVERKAVLKVERKVLLRARE